MVTIDEITKHPLFESRANQYYRWYPHHLSRVGEKIDISSPSPRGIYIHVPFCDRICRFCPFNKRVSNPDLIHSYVNALKNEIRISSEIFGSGNIKFIYFGGGTPSALSFVHIYEILDDLRHHFSISPNAEVTLEFHPTHASIKYLKEVQRAGVTRISSGIQSFHQEILNTIGAQHNLSDGIQCINLVQDTFSSIAIDLLYRCPNQSLADVEHDIEIASKFEGVNHISTYSFIPVSEYAPLPESKTEIKMAIMLHDRLNESGYIHYASCASGGFDFARNGSTCKYEVLHWGAPQTEFIGLGPGAFGFVGNSVTINHLSIDSYCKSLSNNALPLVSVTPTSEAELKRRYFVLGVKTLDVDLKQYRSLFASDAAKDFSREFDYLKDQGFITLDQNRMVLTDIGRLFTDTISEVFFSSEQKQIPHPEEHEIRNFQTPINIIV